MRTRCGITRPTNRTWPDTATADAVSTATSRSTSRRVLDVDAEVAGGPLAEGQQVEAAGEQRARGACPPMASGATTATLGHVAWAIEPSLQKVMLRSCESSEKNVSRPSTAPVRALRAMPVSTIVMTSVRPFWRDAA